ncbi:MAG: hypothetical protein JWM09_614 [Francisellaceae bacterium]|nr:hypothetical protein [Francisellaceae bacterium]
MEGSNFTAAGFTIRHLQTWNSLQVFNCYRLILAIFFVSFSYLREIEHFLGETNPHYFRHISYFYLIFSVFCIIITQLKQFHYNYFISFQILTDILVLTNVMHASGGIVSGLGTLVLVNVACASMLRPGKIAFFYAAFASFAIVGEQLFVHFKNPVGANAYTPAGLISLALFAIAFSTNILARRLGLSQAALISLEQLNGHIIERLHTGVLIVKNNNRIRLINKSASILLNKYLLPNLMVDNICENIAKGLHKWKNNPINFNSSCFLKEPNSHILASFHQCHSYSEETLIFLEDVSRQIKEAEQLKLAALGRLTASIAHEIRNPLSAISHAAQLLSESPLVNSAEHRMLQIIHDNSQRTNTVIKNVLSLSKFSKNNSQTINLKEWLENFLKELILPDFSSLKITLSSILELIEIKIDPSQLYQIMVNLCENGIRYSHRATGIPSLKINIHQQTKNKSSYLDVIDQGSGVTSDIRKRLFEPFVTTESQGTGLGLFIARELCTANQAQLEYLFTPEGESCFRITFLSEMISKVCNHG